MVSDLRCRRLPVASAWTPVAALGVLAQIPAKQVPLTVLAGIGMVLFSGLLLMVVVVAGARYVRRLNRQPPRASQMVSDRWYEKPLVEAGHMVDAEQRQRGGSLDEPGGDDGDLDDRVSGDDP